MEEGKTGNQDEARASSAMRRAFFSSGASTIFPWNRKAPLPWPSGTACNSTVAHSMSAALGVNAKAALANNDGHGFFGALGDQVITGPTRTNVNDFRAILITPQA